MEGLDPIMFEVIRNALTSATEEMALTLRLSAYSTNIKTRADFSCAFFDADLRSVAQAFAQPPDRYRPADRGDECHPGSATERDAEPDPHLNRRERGVGQHQVMADQRRGPGDRSGHRGRIALGHAGQHLREAPVEHERLILQDAVEQPQRSECQLRLPDGA